MKKSNHLALSESMQQPHIKNTSRFLTWTLGSALLLGCAATEKSLEAVGELSGISSTEKCHTPQYLEVGEQGIQLEVTLRDFSSNYPDFENFNSKKLNPSIEDCGSLEQPELANMEYKEQFLNSLKERYPDQFPWATSNSREIYPTFGMVADTLNQAGLPVKGRQACNNDNINEWYSDVSGVNYKIQDKMKLEPVGDDTYKVEFLHFKQNSYLPLDKFASDTSIKNWGKQNQAVWCLNNLEECQKESDLAGQTPNSNPEGSNFGFTMTTQFDFVYNSRYGEYFEFDGDDDYWVFIDGKLAVDAGGTHVLIHNKIQLDSLAQQRGWLDGSTHNLKLFFAERQADASNLAMTFKTKGIRDIQKIAPYIYRSYKLGATPEDSKYLIYVNTPLDSITIQKIQANLDKKIFNIVDDLDNDVSQDMLVKSFTPVPAASLPQGVVAAYEVEFETSSETRFVAPSLGYKLSFNAQAPISIKSQSGQVVEVSHPTQVVSGDLIQQEVLNSISQELCQ